MRRAISPPESPFDLFQDSWVEQISFSAKFQYLNINLTNTVIAIAISVSARALPTSHIYVAFYQWVRLMIEETKHLTTRYTVILCISVTFSICRAFQVGECERAN